MLAFMLHKGFYMAALGGACAVRAYCRLSKECYLPNQVAVEWKKPCQGRAYWWRMLAQSLYCTRLIEKLLNREFKRLTSMGDSALFRGNDRHDLPGPKICSGWRPLVSPRAKQWWIGMHPSWWYERRPPTACFWAWEIMFAIASEQCY